MTSDARKELLWLRDILEAIRKIEEHPRFAEGQQAFESDEHFRVWVVREVVGTSNEAESKESGIESGGQKELEKPKSPSTDEMAE